MADPFDMLNWYWKVTDFFGDSMNDSFCKVRLPLDGTNGSTTITDDNAGGSAHTWTANGNAALTTAFKKYGTASLYLDGTGDYVSMPDSSDITLAALDWTIHGWCRPDTGSNGTLRRIAGQANSTLTAAGTAWYISKDTSNNPQITVSDGSTLTTLTLTGLGGMTSSNTSMRHFMFSRSGNTIRGWLDGSYGGSVAFSGTIPNVSDVLAVGRAGASTSNEWLGWIDHFEIDVGVARKNTNTSFEPPLFPNGQIFKSAGAVDDFVDVTDSGYTTWLANGNVVPSVLGADLWSAFDDYAQLTYVPSSLLLDNQTSDYVISNPPPSYVEVRFASPATVLYLPKARTPRGIPIGKTLLVDMIMTSQTLRFMTINNNSGAFSQAKVDRVGTIPLRLTSNATRDGTWKVALKTTGISSGIVEGLVVTRTNTTTYTVAFDRAITRDFEGNGQQLRAASGLTCDISLSAQPGGPGTLTATVGNPMHFYIIDGDGVGPAIVADNVGPGSATTGPTVFFGFGGVWNRFAYLFTVVCQVNGQVPDVKVHGSEVFLVAEHSLLVNGAATSSTSVSVSSRVPAIATDFTINIQYLGAITDSSGNIIVQTVFEHVNGSLYASRNLQMNGMGVSTVVVGPGGTLTFPNHSQAYRYYTTVTQGSGPIVTMGLISFKVPNGGP